MILALEIFGLGLMLVTMFCMDLISISLADWLDAKTHTENLIHAQFKAEATAINQFTGTLAQITNKHKAKSGN